MKVLRTWNFSVFGSENDEVIPVIGSYIKNVKMLFFCVFKSASPLVRGKDSKKNILIVFISKNEKISKKKKKKHFILTTVHVFSFFTIVILDFSPVRWLDIFDANISYHFQSMECFCHGLKYCRQFHIFLLPRSFRLNQC